MINQVSVCINALAKRSDSLHAAAKFAQRHKATLTGVYIKLDTVEIVRWAGVSPVDFTHQLLFAQDEREQEARTIFEALVVDYECETRWKTVLQSENPIKQMLCTDVIFVEQPMGQGFLYPGDDSFINHLILQSKRPVIVVPQKWDSELGNKPLLGWNASPEAMRATADAIPILGFSKKVLILSILKDKKSNQADTGFSAIQAYLTSKGIVSEVIIEHAPGYQEEQGMLLEYSQQHDIDLIVVGGYGHSRLREIVLGGMTDHLLKHSPIPVLFSH